MMKKTFGKNEINYLIIIFIILFIITLSRIMVGISFNIPVLVLEGYHALVDAVISLLVVATMVVVRSRFAQRFPYGLYRLEDLTAIILSIIILLLLFDNLKNISYIPKYINNIVIYVQLASIPLLLIIIYLKLIIAKNMNSPSMRADAMHVIVDVIESAAVALGLILFRLTGVAWTYKVAFLVSSLGLLAAAFEAGHESLLALLDLPKNRELMDEIYNIIKNIIKDKCEIVWVKSRWAGPVVFVDILLRSHPLDTIEFVGRVTRRIEEELLEKIPEVEGVTITVEPSVRRDLSVAVPVVERRADSIVSKHFARAPYLAVYNVKNNKIININIIDMKEIEFGVRGAEGELLRGAEIAEWLHNLGITDVIVINIGEIAFSLLLRHKILVWKGDPSRTAIGNAEALLKGELDPLLEPTREASWKKK